MEVHAHSHTSRKKWIHYFWEFLMLFLAVFCGFMAENFREHQIEHQREKKYMVTLLEDLKRDTAEIQKIKRYFNLVVARKDSFMLYLKPPVQKDKISQYYVESAMISTMSSFAYSDRTIEQLRQSGNFRLIRKKNITDSLIKYDNRMRNVFAKNYNVLWDERIKLNDELTEIIDYESFEFIDAFAGVIAEDSLKLKNLWPLKLVTNDEKLLMRFYNHALLQRGYMLDYIVWIDRMFGAAENLIWLIQKEYHLK